MIVKIVWFLIFTFPFYFTFVYFNMVRRCKKFNCNCKKCLYHVCPHCQFSILNGKHNGEGS